MTVVDLFSGCGGMSKGFENAGYEIVAAFENWDVAINCYNQNFKHKSFKQDLSDYNEAASKIREYNPLIIIGGPPCQDFSQAGKKVEGDRAELTVSFAHIIQLVSPEYFVMENVEGIVKSKAYSKAKEIFKNSGYGLTEKVLDACLCGVPQKRKRFFCVGSKNDPDGFLDSALSANLDDFPMTIRRYCKGNFEVEYYYRHPRTYDRRAIFSIDEPAPTIRGINRPKPAEYKKHKKDLIDPALVRSLTYKERAIVQTFPDTYIWPADQIGSVEQMIGNAVPVKLAEYVAACLLQYIKKIPPTKDGRFVDWLIKEKHYTSRAAGDALSRVKRSKRIHNANEITEEYLNVLKANSTFLTLKKSVQSQLKRAICLYIEYEKA